VVDNDAAVSDYYFLHNAVTKVVVPDSRKALAIMSANLYGHPSRQLTLLGVTGTNGKTTTTHLIKSVLEAAGHKTGLIGTIEYTIGSDVIPATHTTPESLELNQLLSRMVLQGCTAAVMEVSSHSLAMSRVHGLRFATATFTNLTQDHLDFHGSMEAYLQAKKILFDGLSGEAVAVTNADDPHGDRLVRDTAAARLRYGVRQDADVRARDIHLTIGGSQFSVVHGGTRTSVSSPLTGRFNVANITAAYATGLALGISPETISAGIANLKSVRGRFEQIPSPSGWTAVVDYAHTPDALEHCLRTIRDLLPQDRPGRIITVFGCGGNRDRGKRPIMGNIASLLSDVTVITSDNPRHEEPASIIDDIATGVVQGSAVLREIDRRRAIREGLAMARPGDVVLIAGKGHEDYQAVGDEKHHFDDREEVERFIGGSA
jgi:UDP-N-acetylmuramoyl-L-alanyl-D-glutamate--2,6-diaminopimelate ligase